jgi:hypothetical protein
MPSAVYTIRVNGRLGTTMLSAFPEFDSEVLDGATLLTGRVTDRSALYGVLGRLESLGLELIDVHRLDEPIVGRERSPDRGDDGSPVAHPGWMQPVNHAENGVPDVQ